MSQLVSGWRVDKEVRLPHMGIASLLESLDCMITMAFPCMPCVVIRNIRERFHHVGTPWFFSFGESAEGRLHDDRKSSSTAASPRCTPTDSARVVYPVCNHPTGAVTTIGRYVLSARIGRCFYTPKCHDQRDIRLFESSFIQN